MMLQSEQAGLTQSSDCISLSPTVHARTVPCQRLLLLPPDRFVLRSTASL